MTCALVAEARSAGSPLAVAALDLHHFQTFNDTFEHPAGDRLLAAAAIGWRSRLRATDLLARYGGERFMLALPNTDSASARNCGARPEGSPQRGRRLRRHRQLAR